MIEGFSLIQFTEKDWEDYKTIRLESLKSDPQAFGSNLERELAFDEAKWKSRLAPFSNTSRSIHVAITEDSTNKVVGTMGFYSPEQGVAMIVGVFLKADYRGLKLATYLMHYLIEIIKDKKEFNKIQLSVNKDQTSAFKLYQKSGFKIVGEEKVVLGDGKEHSEFIMELILKTF